MSQTAFLGECMIEIAASANAANTTGPFGPCKLGFAGDTLNAAIYMQRAGKLISEQFEAARKAAQEKSISYVTALGDDPYSEAMIAAWNAEGLETGTVRQIPGALPGLYAIQTDATGERSFSYWRDNAAAKQLLRDGHDATLREQLAGVEMLYLSGISLAILSAEDREILFGLLRDLKNKGTKICFDSNHRARLWPDRETALATYGQLAPLCDIVMPTFDDERDLYGDTSPEACANRWLSAGASEVVVKDGGNATTHMARDEAIGTIKPAPVERIVDTTSAGDSFNGSYLAARQAGLDRAAAVKIAQKIAGCVIGHAGAIVDLGDLDLRDPE